MHLALYYANQMKEICVVARWCYRYQPHCSSGHINADITCKLYQCQLETKEDGTHGGDGRSQKITAWTPQPSAHWKRSEDIIEST